MSPIAEVIGTASSVKHDALAALGIDYVLDYTREPFETAVRDADLAVDLVGGEVPFRSLEVLRPDGRHQSRNGSYLIMSSSGAEQMAAAQRFTVLEGQVDTRFSAHPDAEIILSRTRTGTRMRPPVTSSGSRPTTARTRGPAG